MKKGLLVAVSFAASDKPAVLSLLEELRALTQNIEVEPAFEMLCPLKTIDRTHLIGKGKVAEIAQMVQDHQIDVVIFDHELTPSQQRNLEKLLKAPVIDRREVILDVFSRRAQTKEATLQVELARVRYELPRLKRLWTHLERQAGGGKGYLKGMGEKQIEIDRRLLKEQISSLSKQLTHVHSHRERSRAQRIRSEVPSFAVVGYTNAGKSTLFNAMTAAGVLAEDKLFATLDTTTRQMLLPSKEPVLLVDTVGFIRGIPHTLVAAFRSTLEEALYTDILIHVVDAAGTDVLDKIEASKKVLKELHVDKKQTLYVLNKCDEQAAKRMIPQLRIACSPSVTVSARSGEGLEELAYTMQGMLERLRTRMQVRIPQERYGYAAELIKSGYVLEQHYEGNDIIMEVLLPSNLVSKYACFHQG